MGTHVWDYRQLVLGSRCFKLLTIALATKSRPLILSVGPARYRSRGGRFCPDLGRRRVWNGNNRAPIWNNPNLDPKSLTHEDLRS